MEHTIEKFMQKSVDDSYANEDHRKMVEKLFSILSLSQPPSYLHGVSLLQVRYLVACIRIIYIYIIYFFFSYQLLETAVDI